LEIERINPNVPFLQFVDGDCELVDGWIETGLKAMATAPDLAIVCGRRRERFPDASLYNRLMDQEWNTRVGPTDACGGDSLVRMEAMRAVGGFDETVSAGEEPELCKRLRSSGWRIERIDAEMTWHDSAMFRFSQWWRRQRRSGYGALDVTKRYGVIGFRRELRSARFWTIGWLGITLAAAAIASTRWGWFGFLGGLVLGLAMYAAQLLKMTLRGIRQGFTPSQALCSSCIIMFSKFASMHGQLLWLLDRIRRDGMRQIEYKGPETLRTTSNN
jgi:cellulose synthase/poly-beta-1,6-N-acetylglucosamine synthase-like glycosyltransferase